MISGTLALVWVRSRTVKATEWRSLASRQPQSVMKRQVQQDDILPSRRTVGCNKSEHVAYELQLLGQ